MKNLKKLLKVILLTLFLITSFAAASAFTNDHFNYSKYPSLFYRATDFYGNVKYEYLKKNREELDAFARDIAQLDSKRYERWNEKEKLAFWINTYNALTIKLVVDNYPIDGSLFKAILYPRNSIKQISGAFDEKNFTVMGQSMTLDYIRDSIIRKEFADPRVHMVLVSGAKGSPRLPGAPYDGESIELWFKFQAKHIIDNPDMFKIDYKNRTVYLNEMFDWYGEDFIKRYDTAEGFFGFEAKERAILNYLSKFIEDDDEKQFLRSGKYEVKYMDFDWSLNDEKKAPWPSEITSTDQTS